MSDHGDRRPASAGEPLARRHREPAGPSRPHVQRPRSRYAWLVGFLLLGGVGVLLLTTALPNTGRGLDGPPPGTRLPDFAAPLATGSLEGEANVCQRAPCPSGTGPLPACRVRSAEVVNVCELRRRPLVLTFVFDRGADCFPQVDRVERARRLMPGVSFATVFFTRKERAEVRTIVEARGWRQPVAVDSDGAVANLYRVGGCPTTVFAGAGGRVVETEIGNLTETELRARSRRLAGR